MARGQHITIFFLTPAPEMANSNGIGCSNNIYCKRTSNRWTGKNFPKKKKKKYSYIYLVYMYVFYRYIQVYMYKEFLCYYQMELLENSIKNYLLAITTIAYFIRIYFKLFLDYKFQYFFFFLYIFPEHVFSFSFR